MPSRSQKELRDGDRVQGRPRQSTIGQDLKDSMSGIGKAIGGAVGDTAGKLRNRGRQIDKIVDEES